MSPKTTKTDLPGHMLYGVKAIAEFLGVRPRQALGLIERGHLPHYHIGRVVCANRSTLTAWLADMERRANPAPAAAGPTS